MGHVIEPATSGRAKCRGCDGRIAKDELRFGERLPNQYGEGDMTLWFHPICAAYKRPEPFLEAIAAAPEPADPDAAEGCLARHERERLEAAARLGVEHRRLPRLNGAERAATGRARCRHCRETIAKDAWRIPLVYFEEGRFEPAGFIHAACAADYFGTTALIDRARHFNPALSDRDAAAFAAALAARAP